MPDLSANELVSEVSVEQTSSGLEIYLATTLFADRFEAYTTTAPDKLVVKVYRKLVDLEEFAEEQKKLDRIRGMKILLVDDDDGINNGNILGGVDYDQIYERALTENLITYDVIRVKHEACGPSYDELKGYDCVIWFTGIDAVPCLLSSTDKSNIADYVSAGGNLLFASQNFLSELGVKRVTSGLAQKMGISDVYADTQETDIVGLEGSFADGLALDLDYDYRCGGNWGDGFSIEGSSGIDAVLKGADGYYYGICGTMDSGSFVFVSVAFEHSSMPVNREDFLLCALGWLSKN